MIKGSRYEWYPWFAWYPDLSGARRWRWLSVVETRVVGYIVPDGEFNGDLDYYWEYRPA